LWQGLRRSFKRHAGVRKEAKEHEEETMQSLSGKVALVSGAAGMKGIGRAIAVRLANEGADVVVADRSDAFRDFSPEANKADWKGLNSVVEEIQVLGRGRALAVNADITSSADVEQLISHTLTEFGRIDILVNNAGIMGPMGTFVVDLKESDWELVIRVNLTGSFLMSKAAARVMIERGEGGKIIMIASVAGKDAKAGQAVYSASKAGVLSLTQTLARELAQYKINVNAICPGGVLTDIAYPWIKTLAKEKVISMKESALHIASFGIRPEEISLGRLGSVEEVANAVYFLASPESDYVTGQALNVCEGALTVR
jgi:NAD(P)-dependent dehydrogenase (short-subunit alcohol dehydrogenase family)